MLPDKFALTAIGALCVAAAGAGGYVAMRQAPAAPAAQAAVQADASTPIDVERPAESQAVEETEGVLDTAAHEPAAAPARPAPSPRRVSPEPVPSKSKTPAEQPLPPGGADPRRAARAENIQAAPSPARIVPEPPPAAPPSMPEHEQVAPAPLPAMPPADRLEPAPAPEPPAPSYEELIVSSDSVLGLQTETALSSERARVEDRIDARVVRDVRVSGRVAIPAGTRVLGSVTLVERGGRLRDRARLGVRFHTLAMADGSRVPITTETIYRYGDAPGNGSAAKIGGGAVAGAILGAILGGGKGAAIGATAGATGGGAAVAAGERSEAKIPAGAEVTARILSPVTLSVER